MGITKRILLVEDSAEVQKIVSKVFRGSPISLTLCETIEKARHSLEKSEWDLLLLDISLPDGDGLGFLANLKNQEKFKSLPVVLLTGKSAVHEKIHGYQLGADDYITKPFDPDLLKAIVNSKLQRFSEGQISANRLECGNLEILLAEQKVLLHGNQGPTVLDLPPISFKLLLYFAQHVEHVLSRQQLLQNVWGDKVHITDRTVDSHVSQLRKKLEACDFEITTIYGGGYTFGPRRNGGHANVA